MEKDPLSADLEKLLEGFSSKLAGVKLGVPGLEALPHHKGAFEEFKPAVRPAKPAPAPLPVREPEPAPLPVRKPEPAPLPVWKPEPVSAPLPAVPVPAPKPAPAPAPAPKPVARPRPEASAARPTPPTRIRRRLAAALLLVAGLWLWETGRPDSGHARFPFPTSSSAGIAVQGGDLYAVDGIRHILFTFSIADGRLKDARPFPIAAANGLARGDGYFWSSDAEAGAVYQHGPGPDFPVRRIYLNEVREPSALYWDGWSLWLSDLKTETISQYTLSQSLAPVAQFALPGMVPAGIHFSDNVLWVCDANTSELYRYHPGESAAVIDVSDLKPRLPEGAIVSGFAMDGSYAWIATSNPAQLHRLDLESLVWKAPSRYSGLVKQ